MSKYFQPRNVVLIYNLLHLSVEKDLSLIIQVLLLYNVDNMSCTQSQRTARCKQTYGTGGVDKYANHLGARVGMCEGSRR